MVGLPGRTLRLVAVQAGRLLPLPRGRRVAALPTPRRRPPGRRPRRLQWTPLRGVVRLLLRLPVRRQGLGGPRRPGVDRPDLFVRGPRGRVVRRDLAERAGLPVRPAASGSVAAGRLGEEKEVMGMAVHNGKLYAGTLPLAEVYRLDDGTRWTRTGRLDLTPDVRYRRAWSMAVFDGRLFCGTLPSGRVHALEVGQSVTYRPCARPRLEAPRRRPRGGTALPLRRRDARRVVVDFERLAPGPDQPATRCGSASGRTTISGAASATSASTTGRCRPARSPP